MTPGSKTERAPAQLTVSRIELLQDGSDSAFRQLIQDMLSTSARLQAIRDKFGAIAGISGQQYSMMITIAHMQTRDEPVTVSGLSARLHVSGTFVTAEAQKLVSRGLIQKAPNPVDRRSVVLTLTEAGAALMRSVRDIVRDANDEIFRGLSADDFQVLLRLMAGFVDSLDDALALTEANRLRAAR
jgi:DNA-binding MarR family transcriptional regulator